MVRKLDGTQRRALPLSRERIVEAAIELLDSSGEEGLTFRALSEQLATGPGALYWYIAGKSDLLSAACDAVVARTAAACAVGGMTPKKTIRALALGLFDVMEAHPWVGSALSGPAGQMPMVRVLEPLGQRVRALGVPEDAQWAVVSALLSYILGVGGRSAANGQIARTQGLDRSDYLASLAAAWSQLNPHEYPFTRSLARHVRARDDRADFLAGLNLILKGIG